jgi:hypothetical protein
MGDEVNDSSGKQRIGPGACCRPSVDYKAWVARAHDKAVEDKLRKYPHLGPPTIKLENLSKEERDNGITPRKKTENEEAENKDKAEREAADALIVVKPKFPLTQDDMDKMVERLHGEGVLRQEKKDQALKDQAKAIKDASKLPPPKMIDGMEPSDDVEKEPRWKDLHKKGEEALREKARAFKEAFPQPPPVRVAHPHSPVRVDLKHAGHRLYWDAQRRDMINHEAMMDKSLLDEQRVYNYSVHRYTETMHHGPVTERLYDNDVDRWNRRRAEGGSIYDASFNATSPTATTPAPASPRKLASEAPMKKCYNLGDVTYFDGGLSTMSTQSPSTTANSSPLLPSPMKGSPGTMSMCSPILETPSATKFRPFTPSSLKASPGSPMLSPRSPMVASQTLFEEASARNDRRYQAMDDHITKEKRELAEVSLHRAAQANVRSPGYKAVQAAQVNKLHSPPPRNRAFMNMVRAKLAPSDDQAANADPLASTLGSPMSHGEAELPNTSAWNTSSCGRDFSKHADNWYSEAAHEHRSQELVSDLYSILNDDLLDKAGDADGAQVDQHAEAVRGYERFMRLVASGAVDGVVRADDQRLCMEYVASRGLTQEDHESVVASVGLSLECWGNDSADESAAFDQGDYGRNDEEPEESQSFQPPRLLDPTGTPIHHDQFQEKLPMGMIFRSAAESRKLFTKQYDKDKLLRMAKGVPASEHGVSLQSNGDREHIASSSAKREESLRFGHGTSRKDMLIEERKEMLKEFMAHRSQRAALLVNPSKYDKFREKAKTHQAASAAFSLNDIRQAHDFIEAHRHVMRVSTTGNATASSDMTPGSPCESSEGAREEISEQDLTTRLLEAARTAAVENLRRQLHEAAQLKEEHAGMASVAPKSLPLSREDGQKRKKKNVQPKTRARSTSPKSVAHKTHTESTLDGQLGRQSAGSSSPTPDAAESQVAETLDHLETPGVRKDAKVTLKKSTGKKTGVKAKKTAKQTKKTEAAMRITVSTGLQLEKAAVNEVKDEWLLRSDSREPVVSMRYDSGAAASPGSARATTGSPQSRRFEYTPKDRHTVSSTSSTLKGSSAGNLTMKKSEGYDAMRSVAAARATEFRKEESKVRKNKTLHH